MLVEDTERVCTESYLDKDDSLPVATDVVSPHLNYISSYHAK